MSFHIKPAEEPEPEQDTPLTDCPAPYHCRNDYCLRLCATSQGRGE